MSNDGASKSNKISVFLGWFSENWRLILLGIFGALLLGCTHKWTTDTQKIPEVEVLNGHPVVKWLVVQLCEVSEKLGDAFVIAALLGLLVDPSVKIKLFDEVLKYTGLTVWIRHLPDSLRQEMVKLTRISLVRDCWYVHYTLTPENGLMKVESKVYGFVRNVGPITETLKFFVAVDPSMIPSAPEPSIRKIELSHKNEAPVFSGAPEVHQEKDGTRWSQSFPIKIAPGEELSTSYEMVEYRPLTFISPLFIATSVARTVLTVEHDSKLVEVHVSTGLSDDLPPTDKQMWDITEPLLPGHGLQIRWSMKLSSPALAFVTSSVPAGS